MPKVKDIFNILDDKEKGELLSLARKWEHQQNIKKAEKVSLTVEEVEKLQRGDGVVRVIKQVKDRTGHSLGVCKLAVEREQRHVAAWKQVSK